MSIDEQHVALPKLYGAPAYARPAAMPVAVSPKPFDPDDLPIEALMTDDEREFASSLPVRTWTSGGATTERPADATDDGQYTATAGLRPRSLSLKSIAGKLLGGD